MRVQLLGPLSLLLCAISFAQVSPTSTPRRDATAVAQVQSAINALGGPTAIGAVNDCVVTGAMQPAPGNPQVGGTFIWKHTDAEFRYESSDTNRSTKAFVSGHGKPVVINPDGTARRFEGYLVPASAAPHLVARTLLRELTDQRWSIALEAPGNVGGRKAIRVRIWNDSSPGLRAVTAQVWYFDAVTALPLRLETKHPSNKYSLEVHDGAVEFADYRKVLGVSVPFQFITYVDGELFSVMQLNSVFFNTGVSTTEFDAPAEVAQ
jgi:hypothetical protein